RRSRRASVGGGLQPGGAVATRTGARRARRGDLAGVRREAHRALGPHRLARRGARRQGRARHPERQHRLARHHVDGLAARRGQGRELRACARGVRAVQWKAGDPNGDPLRYRVEVGSSLEGPWVRLADDLDVPSFTWDTHTLPDGIYRVRVTASDLPGNAVGEDKSATGLSEPFFVDNTPPEGNEFRVTAGNG